MLREVHFSDAKDEPDVEFSCGSSKCTELTAVVVTPWTSFREEPVSNPGRSTNYPDYT